MALGRPWQRARRRATPLNLLDLCPERQLDCERGADNTVSVLVPKFTGPILGRLLQPKLKKPHIRIRLDELGTAVWEACDGQTEVRDIVARLAKRFGEDFDPDTRRLATFLRTMEQRGYVRMLLRPGTGQAPAVPAGDQEPVERPG